MSDRKPIDDFLIKIESEYENEVMLGDTKIILTSVFEDPFQLLKTAQVIAVPSVHNGIDANVGDHIFFSHLILKNSFDYNNNVAPNDFLIDPIEKIYRVPARLVYAYTSGDDFFVPEPFFICKPILVEDEVLDSGIFIPGNNEEIKQLGELVYMNQSMKDEGYEKGDKIIFSKDSEYEMKVFGERMYRMRQEWILAKYEE